MKKGFLKNVALKIKNFAVKHKIWTAIIVIVIVGVSYKIYEIINNTAGQVKYVVATVEKGTIISSVTGSGQVSALNQIDIKPKVSGEVLYVAVTPGEQVFAGALIVQLDATDAEKSVRNAEMSLQNAQISYQKLIGPKGLSMPQNKIEAEQNLAKDYSAAFNSLTSSFVDLPTILNGLNGIFFASTKSLSSSGQWNVDYYTNAINQFDRRGASFGQDVYNKYQAAVDGYNKNFNLYKETTRASGEDDIESLLNETYKTSKTVADAVKSAYNLIQLYKDILNSQYLTPSTTADAHLSSVNSYTTTINGHISDLLNQINSIQNDKITLANTSLDVTSQGISLKQAENNLSDAKASLADYFVRAPFSGMIASVGVKKYDTVGSGASVATLITKQKIAELFLNEVDAAKVKVGDKATLTFDAIEELTLTGVVSEKDIIGTVSQGVVSYAVKISFDSEDGRINPGMTVNLSIQTAVKQDVLIIPSNAVKTKSGISYVSVFNPSVSLDGGNQGFTSDVLPEQVEITTGISDDTNVEIVSGLEEGQQVVTRTTTSNTTASSANTTGSANRNSGFGGGAGIRF